MVDLNDPAGVFDHLSEEKKELLAERMYEGPFNAPTEKTVSDGRDVIKWTCPKCHGTMEKEKEYATARCEHCMRMLQRQNNNDSDTDDEAANSARSW